MLTQTFLRPLDPPSSSPINLVPPIGPPSHPSIGLPHQDESDELSFETPSTTVTVSRTSSFFVGLPLHAPPSDRCSHFAFPSILSSSLLSRCRRHQRVSLNHLLIYPTPWLLMAQRLALFSQSLSEFVISKSIQPFHRP